MPENLNLDYFIYSAIQSLSYPETEILNMPLKKLLLYIGFKNHDNWVESELMTE